MIRENLDATSLSGPPTACDNLTPNHNFPLDLQLGALYVEIIKAATPLDNAQPWRLFSFRGQGWPHV